MFGRTVKKYKYIIGVQVVTFVDFMKKRLRSFSFDYANCELDSFKVNELPYPTNWQKFNDHEKLFAEIGTGHGELIGHLSKDNPNNMYIGFEIISQFTRVSNNKVKDRDNAIVFKADAYPLMLNLFADESLDGVYVLFPDPWHKKKHHKRRPLVEDWFRKMHKKLKPGGFIFFATDWDEYRDFVRNEMGNVTDIYELTEGVYKPEDWGFPATHYYKKWVEQGRSFDWIRIEKALD